MTERLERLYRRLGPRYVLPYFAWTLFSGVLLCVIAALTFDLYLVTDEGSIALLALVAGGLTTVALCWTGGMLWRRHWRPVARWIEGGRRPEGAEEAWRAVIGANAEGAIAAAWRSLLVAALPIAAFIYWNFDLEVWRAGLALLAILTAALYPTILHLSLADIFLRPVLRDIAEHLPGDVAIGRARLGLRQRMFLMLPIINVVTGVFVAVLSAEGPRTLPQFAGDLGIAAGVASSTSLILVLLMAEYMLGPIDDLMRTAERVREGDLLARAPVTTADGSVSSRAASTG